MIIINPLQLFYGIESHVALDRNPEPGYNTLLLRLIPGDLYIACLHRQFHTLTHHLHNRGALPNFNPNHYVPSREAICTIFIRPSKDGTYYGIALSVRPSVRPSVCPSTIACERDILDTACRIDFTF